jgi:hypothetical protein
MHETREELSMYNLKEIIVYYKSKWTQRFRGMNGTRIPNLECKDIPNGRET